MRTLNYIKFIATTTTTTTTHLRCEQRVQPLDGGRVTRESESALSRGQLIEHYYVCACVCERQQQVSH